jgi:hypothetical protein
MGDSNAKSEENKEHDKNQPVKDPRTGMTVLKGPSFTKEDVARDFPYNCSRVATIMRRSVGLDRKEPPKDNINPFNEEQVAKKFPRGCCRNAIMMRRLAGLRGYVDVDGKCCYVD